MVRRHGLRRERASFEARNDMAVVHRSRSQSDLHLRSSSKVSDGKRAIDDRIRGKHSKKPILSVPTIDSNRGAQAFAFFSRACSKKESFSVCGDHSSMAVSPEAVDACVVYRPPLLDTSCLSIPGHCPWPYLATARGNFVCWCVVVLVETASQTAAWKERKMKHRVTLEVLSPEATGNLEVVYDHLLNPRGSSSNV